GNRSRGGSDKRTRRLSNGGHAPVNSVKFPDSPPEVRCTCCSERKMHVRANRSLLCGPLVLLRRALVWARHRGCATGRPTGARIGIGSEPPPATRCGTRSISRSAPNNGRAYASNAGQSREERGGGGRETVGSRTEGKRSDEEAHGGERRREQQA